MPNKKNWLKIPRLNVHGPGTGCALIVIALTQVPVGIKNLADIVFFCKKEGSIL